MSIRSSDANSDFAPLNYVHCVTDITSVEQDFVSRAVKHLHQFTQLLGARVVERLKHGHLTQCFNGHRGRQILSTPKYARSENTRTTKLPAGMLRYYWKSASPRRPIIVDPTNFLIWLPPN